MKVIHIDHMSPSFFNVPFKKHFEISWPVKTAKYLKKHLPEIDFECWGVERTLKKEKSFVRDRVRYRIFPTTFSPKFSFELSIPLLKALKKEKKAILHLHGCYTFMTYSVALFFKKFPLFVQNHGDRHPLGHFYRYPKLKLAYPLIWILEQIAKSAIKHVDVFFVNDQNDKKYLESFTRAKIQIQGMGIDDELLPIPSKKASKSKLKLKTPTILFIGALRKNKGPQHLIRAMHGIDAQTIIAGTGPLQSELKTLAKKFAPDTIFPGYIQGRTKKQYLAAADLFVLPSYTEGQPVSVKEAIAANVPVVSTKVGGIPELVTQGKNGFLVEPANANALHLAIKKALNTRFGNISQFAKKWHWNYIAQNTQSHYKRAYKLYFES